MPNFPAQVTTDIYVVQIFYIIATAGALMVMVALALMDAGLAQPKNVLDTLVQKLLCALISGVSFLVVGYGVWNWQFYQALGIPDPLAAAVKDWWLLGTNLNTLAQHLDPAEVPEADVLQLFAMLFAVFAGIIGCFIHGAGLERMKPLPSFIMAALAGGVFFPVTTYITWGSAGPLTNAGLHDFVGSIALYIFVGLWSLILSWRLGPRRNYTGVPGNAMVLGLSVFVLILAIPLAVLGAGYLIPGKGYFGITYTEAGLGLVFTNIFMAFAGGTLSGAALAYHLRKPAYALLGPIAGYVACTAIFDIALPWEALCISLGGPLIMHAGLKLVDRWGIDDPKIAPLALGPAIYSVLMAGVIGAGKPTGGMLGVTEGPFAYQHAHISLGMQVFGLAIMLPAMALSAGAVILLIEKTIGLRVTKAQEDNGLDAAYLHPKPTAVPTEDKFSEVFAPDHRVS